jgi:hypothetical protein
MMWQSEKEKWSIAHILENLTREYFAGLIFDREKFRVG